MKKITVMLAAMMFVFAGIQAKENNKLTVHAAPPVVVKTFPQAGAIDVDPNIKEIKVTFSKQMFPGCWSWCTASNDSYPKTTGKAKYLNNKRTCVLPVALEPNKTYAMWLNTAKYTGFRDTGKRSAIPYLLVFKTKK